jgi:serine/threonine protein kinase
VCAWEREALGRVKEISGSGGARVVRVLVEDAGATLTGTHNFRQALVLELVEGLPLRGKWTEAEIVKFLQSMCGLLRRVHAAGVVHLDLKPGNILKVEKTGELVLIDVGASGIGERRRAVRTGEGTAWVAPEVRAGQAGSAKSDVYGLGMTALQLLCGLSHATLASLVHSASLDARGYARQKSGCSADLADVIGGMCARLEVDRPRLEDIRPRLERCRTLGNGDGGDACHD